MVTIMLMDEMELSMQLQVHWLVQGRATHNAFLGQIPSLPFQSSPKIDPVIRGHGDSIENTILQKNSKNKREPWCTKGKELPSKPLSL
jgi:hypothetical protein